MKQIGVLLSIVTLTVIIASCRFDEDDGSKVVRPVTLTTAKAGSDRIVMLESNVVLDGSKSSDPQNDPLNYNWAFVSKPNNSVALLADSMSVNPSFTADVTGDYLIQLAVNDLKGNSDTDAITIRVTDGKMSASRISGVAPLSVFFDSGFISSTETERPFHDLKYKWDFGDNPFTKWAITESTSDISGASKNEDSGPVAAHVFDASGNYTVTLTIENASGDTTIDSITISVSDPDVFYDGAKTVCISDLTSNNFDGCPVVAAEQRIATNNILDLRTHIGTEKRILLHRGSSWSASETVLAIDNVVGPVTIGAYGDCINQDSRGICENAPEINMAASANFLSINNSSDWRIQDISFVGDKQRNSVLSSVQDLESVLLLRIKSEGFATPVAIDFYDTDGHDQVSVVDCNIYDAGALGMWIGSERLSIMGNRVRWTTGEHNIRIWQAYYGVVSHNVLYESEKIGLKFHGPSEERVAKTSDDEKLLDNRSENIVISDNIIGNTYVLAMTVGAQNDGTDERLNEILIEKNRFLSGYGTVKNSENRLSTHLSIYSSNVTIRNNVFDGTGSPSYTTAIAVDQYGSPISPTNVNIYNNTIYFVASSQAPPYYGINIYDVVNVKVKNNLVQLPSNPGNAVFYCSVCGEVSSQNNLLTYSPAFIDPTNANDLLRNFDLQSGSPARDYGVALPVLDDCSGDNRTLPIDAGAYEYN